MKVFISLLSLLLASSVSATSPAPKPPGYYRCNAKTVSLQEITPELIFKSEFIFEGTIKSPVTLIEEKLNTGMPDYVASTLVELTSLKGSLDKDEVIINNFTRENPYGVCVKNLLQTNDKKVIVFLVRPDAFSEGFYYFSDSPNSLGMYSEEKSLYIKQVLQDQENDLKSFNSKYSHLKKHRLHRKIRRLINKSLKPKYKQSAFDEITRLGKPAIPYLILLLDDYRPLSPGFTMSPYSLHYGPEVVVDELATILSYLTEKHFASIYNGGSKREREHAIRAWRLYLLNLDKTKNEE